MSETFKKVAFLFPGQGAQYVGMGKDFYDTFPLAKETFEEADDLLKYNLTKIVFEGPEALLTETKNSQLGIFTVSMAILRVIQQLYPTLKPSVCSGLSLGEYTALVASGKLTFKEALQLVAFRGQFMNDACNSTAGTMAVVLGLDASTVEQLVKEVNLPNDLWAANFNCPGQVVLSGTMKGIEVGSAAAKAKGAKRVVALQVHGAFHSGLMNSAAISLAPYIEQATFAKTPCELVMNVPGVAVSNIDEMRRHLIQQVTHSVRWEQGVRFMMNAGVDTFLEFGCGSVLSGFNRKIGTSGITLSIETTSQIKALDHNLMKI